MLIPRYSKEEHPFQRHTKLFGWLSGLQILSQYNQSFIPIAPSTSLSFILLSIAFFLKNKAIKNKHLLSIANYIIYLVLFISGVLLIDFLLKLGWNFDDLLVQKEKYFGKVPMWEMSPITAVLFLLQGLTLLNAESEKKINRYINHGFSIVTLTFSFFLVIAYLYLQPLFYGLPIIPVALPTSINFLILSISTIYYLEYNYHPFKILYSDSIDGVLMRILLPFLLGLISIHILFEGTVYKELQTPSTFRGLALFFTIPLIALMTYWVSRKIKNKIILIETKLKRSEEKFIRYANNDHDILYRYILIPSPKLEYVSPAIFKIAGYTPEECYSNPKILQFISSSKNDYFEEIQNNSDKSPSIYTIDWSHKNGSILKLECLLMKIFNTEGKLIAIEGISRNITKNIFIQNSIDQFRTLIENTSSIAKIGGWEYILETKNLFWTNETYNIHGLDIYSKINVENSINHYHVDDREKVSSLFQNCIEHGKPYNAQVRLGDKWVIIIGQANYKDGKIISVNGIIQDIDDLKKTEERLKQKEEEIQQLKFKFVKIDLTQMALRLTQKREWIESLAVNISKLKVTQDNPLFSEINKIRLTIKKMNFIQEDSNFIPERIETVNYEFYQSLKKKYPSLTKSEIDLIFKIKTGLSIKQISQILNIAPNSVIVKRYRLRKKLAINEDLDNFIHSLN